MFTLLPDFQFVWKLSAPKPKGSLYDSLGILTKVQRGQNYEQVLNLGNGD